MLTNVSAAQTDTNTSATGQTDALPVVVDEFVADFDDQDLVQTKERAWEYRPYLVAVWFCLDGSPVLNSIYNDVASDVTRRSELMDPSGWDLTTGKAPSRWRNRFLECIETPENCGDLEDNPALAGFDKLMVVCLNTEFGQTKARVREYDIQTQLWGPLVVRHVTQKQQLGQHVMDAISTAFMPLARIDRIQELEYTDGSGKQRKKDEVVMQVRAVRSCVRTDLNEALEWTHSPIDDSPVFIKDDDRFLPVIRKTDRQGNLVSLNPVQFTYLTVNDQDQAVLKASIESYHRAPLSLRKSKRAQKLALVIRPPERPTRLFLVSNDKKKTAMEGFEIYSRRPGATRDEKSEFLGKTDWRGSIEIPPSDEGLRLIYVKRGTRALKKLPIMPGLYEEVESTLPNDETRLYAEGVIQGFQNEILSLVIRREVLESDVAAAIKEENLSLARETFRKYQELDTPSDVKSRMDDERVQLNSLTSDSRELDFIKRMFDSLRKILDDQAKKSQESILQEAIQKMIQNGSANR